MIVYYTIPAIALLAAMSPGPDFLVVTQHAIQSSRSHALMATVGLTIGLLIHCIYCVLGLAAVISHSLILFSAIKYLGAIYLIYLGLKNWKASKKPVDYSPQHPSAKSDLSTWTAFRDGLFTNVLNPKCTLFMLSIFTIVIQPHTPVTTQILLAAEIITVTAVWFTFISYSLTTPIIQSGILKIQPIIIKLISITLIAMGIFVLCESI